MKIAIVEDLDDIIDVMAEAATEAGHHVLGVLMNSDRRIAFIHKRDNLTVKTCTGIQEAVQVIANFEPDIVLLDDFFGSSFNGDGSDIASGLGLDINKLVSISSQEQVYCDARFSLNKSRWRYDPEIKSGFVRMLTVIQRRINK